MPSNPDPAKGLPGGHPDPLRSHPVSTASIPQIPDKGRPVLGNTNTAPAYDLEGFMKEHPTLMPEQALVLLTVAIGVNFYKSINVPIKPYSRTHMPIKFSIVTSGNSRIDQSSLKTSAGHNRGTDEHYKQGMNIWHCPQDLQMGSCPYFPWIGVGKKVEVFDDPKVADEFYGSQLLGSVDYDFDKDNSKLGGGIRSILERTANMATVHEGRLRGSAWIGMLTLDQQDFNRHIQMQWAAKNNGRFVVGPLQISPGDFAIAGYVDCAALCPFAYQYGSPLVSSYLLKLETLWRYHDSTYTHFVDYSVELLQNFYQVEVDVLFANLHDLLFDMGCSSRISLASYAVSTRCFDHDLPQAFVIGYIDAMAMDTLHQSPHRTPTYGDNAIFAICAWNVFNVRYAAWERFIKYTRLIQRFDSSVAARILKSAKENPVLHHEGQDLREAWEETLDPNTASKLIPRHIYTHMYELEDPTDDLHHYGVSPPELCRACSFGFREAFFKKNHTIQAITGLPPNAIYCAPVTLAAAIRRGALWAATSDCCNPCACTIGTWTNIMSDRPVVALMQTEQKVCTRDWLLQNYVMGCVAFSPLRLVSILAGFDATADITFEAGAMGEETILQC
ncbi:hypothetical protein LSUB1_G002175 [Lachnellula subtilissima]|uniref:Uncharacterized protein n=1 Tax=Lachnellula subtilissima TaxID=602034 RepID=A0A8H8UEX5_9HELO|nr:hypothetical protein LSUB1_G002175 [Lachnellula subtilissima]